jgi:hypothetical protein
MEAQQNAGDILNAHVRPTATTMATIASAAFMAPTSKLDATISTALMGRQL